MQVLPLNLSRAYILHGLRIEENIWMVILGDPIVIVKITLLRLESAHKETSSVYFNILALEGHLQLPPSNLLLNGVFCKPSGDFLFLLAEVIHCCIVVMSVFLALGLIILLLLKPDVRIGNNLSFQTIKHGALQQLDVFWVSHWFILALYFASHILHLVCWVLLLEWYSHSPALSLYSNLIYISLSPRCAPRYWNLALIKIMVCM